VVGESEQGQLPNLQPGASASLPVLHGRGNVLHGRDNVLHSRGNVLHSPLQCVAMRVADIRRVLFRCNLLVPPCACCQCSPDLSPHFAFAQSDWPQSGSVRLVLGSTLLIESSIEHHTVGPVDSRRAPSEASLPLATFVASLSSFFGVRSHGLSRR
jgi:hypothetical protein